MHTIFYTPHFSSPLSRLQLHYCRHRASSSPLSLQTLRASTSTPLALPTIQAPPTPASLTSSSLLRASSSLLPFASSDVTSGVAAYLLRVRANSCLRHQPFTQQHLRTLTTLKP
ncbi:hypothetical protein PHAVU_002G105600 [Phaseolus vulgaris]|uniref:Uncharacterized protein n=1 Tax=Phaseolus vulgaris TaxID=3885 RepID=V7CLT7_PHAVU|nr:hypothetical protein PHAVU_002G105600g [Phaseolus vulgaris]ESW29871.1 hypothetical protein PHAVU_002G105600g [Phaseolus vulgaris]